VHTRHTNGALAALAAAGVLTALLFGSVTAAHATPISRANALRAAKQYLRTAPFSFQGLVEQLEYEGFTHAQAVHGARAAGL
jgi:3-deoxy-D-arabino-heptulosonate 7-phosphate (DAHP) synthase